MLSLSQNAAKEKRKSRAWGQCAGIGEKPSALPVPGWLQMRGKCDFFAHAAKKYYKGVEFSRQAHYTVCEKRFLPMQGIQGGVDLGI
jgi:hypothetical protein